MKTGANLFLRKDGRWEARYQKGRAENGRIIYGFVYGSTTEEAEMKRADALRKLYSGADDSISALASLNPNVSSFPLYREDKGSQSRGKIAPAMDDEQAEMIHKLLIRSDNISAFAFLLSLHMGLSPAEAVAVTYSDIDFEKGELIVSKKAVSVQRKLVLTEADGRTLPIPQMILRYIAEKHISEREKNLFVFNGLPQLAENVRSFDTAFKRFLKENDISEVIPSGALQSTFVRRCLEANMNIETVSALTGLDKNRLYRFFGKYIRVDLDAMKRINNIGNNSSKKMRILILGRGDHGSTAADTCSVLRMFDKISFLDDNKTAENIIGKCGDYRSFVNEYPLAYPGFGNNELRKEWFEKLHDAGFIVPTLVHPTALIAPSAKIGEGTIVEARATVNANVVIGKGGIISTNTTVDVSAEIGDFVYTAPGITIPKRTVVDAMSNVNMRLDEIVL